MSNSLAVEIRTEFRKSVLHDLRKEGYIPAVVYGRDEESKTISVKKADLFNAISEVGRNGVLSLQYEGKSRDAVLGDFQYDPIQKNILHADFLYVNKNTELNTKVNVSLIGTAKGVKEGGVLRQILHELNISAKPQDIPELIEVDVSSLEVNDSIKVGMIRENYRKLTIRHEDEEIIADVILPKVEEDTDSDENQGDSVQ